MINDGQIDKFIYVYYLFQMGMNEGVSTLPQKDQPKLDLKDLHLLHLINRFKSITLAAEAVGLTQSALSRKLQAIEQGMGVQLFYRSTRKLSISPAGQQLLGDTAAIPNILNSAIQRISENFLGSQKRIHIGLSSSLSLAHLPGIFHPQSNLHPEVKIIISQFKSAEVIHQVATNELDLGIVNYRTGIESRAQIHHQMADKFCLIVSCDDAVPSFISQHFKKWAARQTWILPPEMSQSRREIDDWLVQKGVEVKPNMELESYDLMCQLTALKMGVAFVPIRALSAFPRRKQLQKLSLLPAIERKLVVIGAKNIVGSKHIDDFTRSILFS